MDNELLHILQHSLGLNQYGEGRQHRNHYVAGGKDIDLCRALCALGYMIERAQNNLTGGSPWFSVTPAGIDAVAFESPSPPKLTRGQKNYLEYLEVAECFDSFKHWLQYTAARKRNRQVTT